MTIADLVKDWKVKPDIDLLRFVKKIQGQKTVHHVRRESQSPPLFCGKLHTVYFHNPGEYIVQVHTRKYIVLCKVALEQPKAVLVRAYEFRFDEQHEKMYTPQVLILEAGVQQSYDEALKLLNEHPEATFREGMLERAQVLKNRRDALARKYKEASLSL